MPRLHVLGGANGAGKSTWYHTGVKETYFADDLPFINVDAIVLKELGGYTQENINKAEQLARERITSLIKDRKDFMIESNLAKTSDYDWISAMRKNGYETSLFFLGTDNVQINQMRVQQRVLEGGHDIPPALIEHRYQLGLSYLKSRVLEFDDAILIDVSRDVSLEMARLKLGRITYKHQELSLWARETLHIAERLQEKLAISKGVKLHQKIRKNGPHL